MIRQDKIGQEKQTTRQDKEDKTGLEKTRQELKKKEKIRQDNRTRLD